MSGEAAFACRTGVWSPVTQKKKKLCQDKLVARYQRFSFVFSLFFCTGLSPKFVSPFARRALFSHLQRGWKKKKKGGLPEAFPGNSLVLFFSSISVVCHSSFIVHALTFRKFTIRSRSHHHDTITFHVQYAQHPPLPCPSPTHHNLLLFCLVLPSTVLRGHIFCVRAPFLRRKKKKRRYELIRLFPGQRPMEREKASGKNVRFRHLIY